MVTIERK